MPKTRDPVFNTQLVELIIFHYYAVSLFKFLQCTDQREISFRNRSRVKSFTLYVYLVLPQGYIFIILGSLF